MSEQLLEPTTDLILPSREDYDRYIATLPPLHHMELPDGRTLSWRDMGPEDGLAVVSMHGNPGSSAGPHASEETLYELNVRLIAPDRPGYGGSSPHPGLYIEDTAPDVACLMNELGIERFGLVAGSGGVPHALACAAPMPERIIAVVGLSGIAPPHEIGTDVSAVLTDDNIKKYKAAEEDPDGLAAEIKAHADATRDDPFALILHLYRNGMTPDDVRILNNQKLCCGVAAGHVEGLRQDGRGWLDDMIAVRKLWRRGGKLDLSAITAPTSFWHGANDPFSDYWNSEFLGMKIPYAAADIQRDASHFHRLKHLRGALLRIVLEDRA